MVAGSVPAPEPHLERRGTWKRGNLVRDDLRLAEPAGLIEPDQEPFAVNADEPSLGSENVDEIPAGRLEVGRVAGWPENALDLLSRPAWK